MIPFYDRMGNKLTTSQVSDKTINRFKNILLDFELLLLRWVGHLPFHSLRSLFYKISGIKLGRGSAIHMWCNFFYPANIEIGEDTIIGNNAFLDGRDKLKIGNHVAVSSQVLIYNSSHDYEREDFAAQNAPVIIEDYVFIGPRCIILPGVTIKKGAVVAANAVVTHDVGEFEIVAGVPAKVIAKRSLKNLHYRLGRARLFQ